MKQEHPLSEEGYALMGAAFEVHNVQGGGLLEEIYQQSLEIELKIRGIPFRPKQELKVYYKDVELEKKYIPDLYVFEKIVVELKSVSDLAPEHEAQLLNYMRITRCPVGYLINFGPIGKLQYKRFILSEFIKGRMGLIEAKPDEFNQVSMFALPKGEGPCWTHPVINDGKLYLRWGDKLHVYEIKN